MPIGKERQCKRCKEREEGVRRYVNRKTGVDMNLIQATEDHNYQREGDRC